jgi:LPS export ABC transporter protein LptC
MAMFLKSLISKMVLLAFVCSILLISSCENKVAEVEALFSKQKGVDESHGIEAYMSSTGKMRGRLRAPLMLHYQDSIPRMVFPKSLHVDFFNDSTRIESRLDARYAEYFEQTNKVFLRDSVKVFNNIGDTLFCDELWWDQTLAKFYTDKPVEIHKPKEIIKGIGMSATQDFRSFEIYKISNSLLRVQGMGIN